MTLATPLLLPLKVCPIPPPGAQAHLDQITGYVLFGVLSLFAVGIAVGIGSIVAGKIFNMPHASKGGVVALAVLALAAVAYGVVPPIIAAILGGGCI